MARIVIRNLSVGAGKQLRRRAMRHERSYDGRSDDGILGQDVPGTVPEDEA